jgi:peptidoglycan hydrolase-like protein with peptidoglycan-binding domain
MIKPFLGVGGALLLLSACSLFQPPPAPTPPPAPVTYAPAQEAAPQPPATSLRRGNTGHAADVSLQQALAAKGYYWGPIDGVYGAGTRTAVMNFQRDLGVPVTGIAGHREWSALGLSSGQREPVPPPTASDAPVQIAPK